MNTASQADGASFLRSTRSKVAFGAFSIAAFSIVGTSAAFAAPPEPCDAPGTGNHVDAASGDLPIDIQTLLNDPTQNLICVSGTFVLENPLTFDRAVYFYGVSDAVLDGDDTTRILQGAIDPPDGQIVVVDNLSLINGNADDGAGGAISAYGVIAVDSRFENNTGATGGAIYAYAVETSGSTFIENTATTGGGGAIAVVSGGPVGPFVNSDTSTFVGNTANGPGGALFSPGELFLRNSTLANNAATGGPDGDGGATFSATAEVTQSTFLNNTATGEGNSLFASEPDDSLLYGNIFAGPSGEDNTQLGSVAGLPDFGGNLFSSGAENLLNPQPSTRFSISVSSLFNGAALASNGGPTQTIALWAGSPAINAVPANPVYGASTDQRGVDRTALSDAGAYEFVATAPAALPDTGAAQSGWLAAAAAVLLAAGAGLFGATRRRSAQS